MSDDVKLNDDAVVFARVLMDEARVFEAAAVLCDGRTTHARHLRAVAGRYRRAASLLALLASDHYFDDDDTGVCASCGHGIEAHV